MALKRQIDVLNERIEGVGRPRNFAEVVLKPYDYVRCVDSENLIFTPDRKAGGEAWRLICQLGKTVHQNTPRFFKSSYTYGKPCVLRDNNTRSPRTLVDMTDEQMLLSAKMMNEIVEVYNKYFEQANRFALYADRRNGAFEEIPIFYHIEK